MFWYVSEEKLETLIAVGRSFWPKSLQLKIKEPFTGSEVGMSQVKADSLTKDIDKLSKLMSERDVKAFHELDASAVQFLCTFEGCAARVAEHTGFWVALAEANTALLLAGSTANTLGKHSLSGNIVSPSADPVNSVRRAFRRDSDDEEMTLIRNLSYAWQAVWRTTNGALAVPTVQGVAVIAGIFPANKAEMRRAKMPNIERLIVGSPVFVQHNSS